MAIAAEQCLAHPTQEAERYVQTSGRGRPEHAFLQLHQLAALIINQRPQSSAEGLRLQTRCQALEHVSAAAQQARQQAGKTKVGLYLRSSLEMYFSQRSFFVPALSVPAAGSDGQISQRVSQPPCRRMNCFQ